MASASQKKNDFLSQKLRFLKVQGDQLISYVGDYVNEIIETGESWTEGGDTHMGYMELCQLVDTAVVFLWEKGEELSANHPLRPSCEVSADTSLSPTTRTSITSHRQPAAPPLTCTTTTCIRQPSVSVPPTDEIQLKAVLARIAVIEEALCSFRGNAEKAAEQKSVLDQQLKEIVSEVTESDKKTNSRFRKIKKQVKEQISEINELQVSLGKEQEARLQSLEKQLEKLSVKQERMKVEMTSQTDLSEKFVHVPDQLESVKENIDVLEARIDRIIDDCSNKDQEIENVMRDLANKVTSNTDTDKAISERQDKTRDLLGELETRFQTLEANSDKAEANFRILCQLFNDRLSPLEQLRTCLNERAIGREENIRKLTQVIQEVAELKSTRTRCGFTAEKFFSRQAAGDTIKPYLAPLSNVGGNFNVVSGIFTAPVDGLYVASVSLHLNENEALSVSVIYKRQGQGQGWGKPVCWISSAVKETTASSMGVVDMKADDTLHLYVDAGEASYGDSVWFSCFLLA